MTYFVTGATGFIGRRLLQELVEHREGTIFVLVRPGSEAKLQRHAYLWGRSDRVVPVAGELTEERLGVDADWIAEHAGSIEHVFHLAASYDITASREANDRLNVDGTRHAVELATALDAGHFHLASSIAVSGDFAGSFSEEMFDEGQSFPSDYHRTKFASEKLVRDECTVPWRVYRPAIVVGDSETGQIDKIDGPYYFFGLIKRLRNVLPQWVPMFAAGMGFTNVVPVDYVARAMDHLAHADDLDGRVFHLTNPWPQRNLDVINAFAKAARAPGFNGQVDAQVSGYVPTQLIQSVLGKVTGTRAGAAVADQTLGRLGVPAEVLAHVAMPTRYDCETTRELLRAADVELPELETYASALWDYWEQNLDPDITADTGTAEALHGRVVVITGASSGIGRAAALRVAALGGVPVLVARGIEKLERLRDEIVAAGGSAHVQPCDLSDLDDIDRLAKTLSTELDRVDFVVNNAGRSIRRSLRLSTDRFHDFERTMQLNYFGAIRLVMGLIPKMAAGGGGHIVNVSSIGVQTHPPRFSAYVASKAALDSWSRVVSSELVGDSITFTSIHMPLVRTPMIAPTKIYDAFPTISPSQAADLVIRAMEDRPHEINTLMGTAGQVAHALTPRAAFQVLHQAYKVFPDSAAARGDAAPQEASRQQRTLARVLKGVHW